MGAVVSRVKQGVAGGVQSGSEPLRQKMVTFDYIASFFSVGTEKEH
jgi:hypothetical protein